ncbi:MULTISPECIES: LysR family transcriptional regulator [unclassified Cupriavidus]|uniref:LysR family transcriptional regulator n=1 Tax=Cupriavidus sp. H19C3 TaxID=3241603 RepID=UPI0011DC0E47|nr:MAG: LysR family transcriptional regulator [Cupriavidus sp.]
MTDPLQKLCWDDLRLIKAIAERGSLVAAAEALGINHSTISRRLAQAERTLGAVLFDRHRTGYAPTGAGADMIALAERVERDIVGVTRRLSGAAPGLKGTLRIATSDALLLDFLMPVVAAFRTDNPAIRIDIMIGNKPLNLARGEADIAFRATTAPPENLFGRKVGTVAWAIYGRRIDYVGQSCPRDALYQQRWVSYGKGLAGLKAYPFIDDHVHADHIVYRSDSVASVASAIAAGIGIGLLPCMHGDLQPGLVRISAVEPAVYDELWVLTHPDIRKSERVHAFMTYCAEALGAQRDIIEGRTLRTGPYPDRPL